MGMVIIVTNCYENLWGIRGSYLFCYVTDIFLMYLFLQLHPRLALKSNAICICMYPPVFCNTVVILYLSLDIPKSTKNFTFCYK